MERLDIYLHNDRDNPVLISAVKDERLTGEELVKLCHNTARQRDEWKEKYLNLLEQDSIKSKESPKLYDSLWLIGTKDNQTAVYIRNEKEEFILVGFVKRICGKGSFELVNDHIVVGATKDSMEFFNLYAGKSPS